METPETKLTLWRAMRTEIALIGCGATAILFYVAGDAILHEASIDGAEDALIFIGLFSVMLWASFSIVRHADALAEILGEPYGTLILTLLVTTIEVVLISAVMLTGSSTPTLARDMMFSVLMIVLNGMVGFTLLLGGYRHVEQHFNLQGANAFLSVIVPLSVLALILPDYTKSTPDSTFSVPQAEFLIGASVALYAVFLGVQTLRHRDYFVPPKQGDDAEAETHESRITVRAVPYHTFLVIAYLIPIVYLSKKLAIVVDYGITDLGAPVALGGLLVAILVLAPEALTAFRAALANRLQRSINVCLGSAVATIGLTVPAVLCIGFVTGETIVLGLNPVEQLLLILTLAVSFINFSSGKSNVLQGAIHLTLFVAYVVLIFD